jgi:hypothetical protein
VGVRRLTLQPLRRGQGDVLHIEKLKDAEVGTQVRFDKVLLLGSRDQTLIGRPSIPNAMVSRYRHASMPLQPAAVVALSSAPALFRLPPSLAHAVLQPLVSLPLSCLQRRRGGDGRDCCGVCVCVCVCRWLLTSKSRRRTRRS